MYSDLIMHFRVNRETGKLERPNELSAQKGGVTVAGRVDGDYIHWAMSRCAPSDLYNRKVGFMRSFGLTKSKSYKGIITPNVEYDVAKKIGTVIAQNASLGEALAIDSYVDLFCSDPTMEPEAAPLFVDFSKL